MSTKNFRFGKEIKVIYGGRECTVRFIQWDGSNLICQFRGICQSFSGDLISKINGRKFCLM